MVVWGSQSVNRLRQGLQHNPPLPGHANLPLATQLAVANFRVEFRFQLEGVDESKYDIPVTNHSSGSLGSASTSTLQSLFPSVTVPFQDLMIQGPSSRDVMTASNDEADGYTVDLSVLHETARTLLERAYQDYRMVTEDEMATLSDAIATTGSFPFALRLSSPTGEKASSHWSEFLLLVDLMEHPNDLARWLRQKVTTTFADAAAAKTSLADDTITTYYLAVEVLELSSRPFHLSLYLEEHDVGNSSTAVLDVAAWRRYVHLLHVRARRQKAEGAFYGSLRALQEEPVVASPVQKGGAAQRLWRRRRTVRSNKQEKQLKEQLSARESEKLQELRSRLHSARNERTRQIGQRLKHQSPTEQSSLAGGDEDCEWCSDEFVDAKGDEVIEVHSATAT